MIVGVIVIPVLLDLYVPRDSRHQEPIPSTTPAPLLTDTSTETITCSSSWEDDEKFPDTRLARLRAILNINATTSSFFCEASPQKSAIEWLSTVQFLGHDLELTQKFALATIYYATGGASKQWNQEDGWLHGGRSVCDWDFVSCDTGERVVELDLGTSY